VSVAEHDEAIVGVDVVESELGGVEGLRARVGGQMQHVGSAAWAEIAAESHGTGPVRACAAAL
jgi:hypothetical protein